MKAIARFRPEYIRVVREWRGRVFCIKARWEEAMFIYAKHQ